MPGLDEFGLIAELFAPLAQGHGGAFSLTDDCALFPGPAGRQWAVTKDALVAGVHFLPDDPPDLIARKLVRVNLSDLAAMGAKPCFLLLAICLPKQTTSDWLHGFTAGLKADAAEFGFALIGGDTVATPGPLTLSLTAIGELPESQALRRSTARSGDDIWVSGTIGDAAFGLLAALGRLDSPKLLDRYRLPRPRVTLGPRLLGLATAGMDISDGLLGDLGHICETSHLAAEIESEAVPLSPEVQAAIAMGAGQGLATALTGGDDYELLFTADPSRREEIRALGQSLDLRLSLIGRMIAGGPSVTVRDGRGHAVPIQQGGYKHFSGDKT